MQFKCGGRQLYRHKDEDILCFSVWGGQIYRYVYLCVLKCGRDVVWVYG